MDWDEAAERYYNGATLRELASDAGMSYQTVRRRLEAMGVGLRGKRPTEETRRRQSLAKIRYWIEPDRLAELADGTRSVREIALILHVPEEVARHRMVDWGIARLAGKARPERNAFWRGGLSVDKHGYILEKRPEHPQATRSGYVRQHRLVMEASLGRLLDPAEVVDHVNRDTSDNRIENLHLYPSNAEHLRATVTGTKNLTPQEREARRRAAVQRARQRVDAILRERGSGADPSP